MIIVFDAGFILGVTAHTTISRTVQGKVDSANMVTMFLYVEAMRGPKDLQVLRYMSKRRMDIIAVTMIFVAMVSAIATVLSITI
jgi:hypothetical protein